MFSRIAFLKNRLARQGIQIKNESPQWSEVQAVLSRGDERLTPVLADIERSSLPAWREAVEKHRLDVDYFAHQRWEISQRLPWAILDSGAPAENLAEELQKALA
jgi:hypothetical protein